VATAGANHLRAERADHRVVRQVIAVHGCAVMAAARIAVDEQVSAAVAGFARVMSADEGQAAINIALR